MSSSDGATRIGQRPGTSRLSFSRLSFSRLSLRTRLVSVLVGLLLISCAALTAISALALHSYLVERLDQQLRAAGSRYSISLEHPPDGDADTYAVIGQSVGTLGARSLGGVVTSSGVVIGATSSQPLSAADQAALGRVGAGGPRDVHLPDLGEYRVIALAGRDGDLQLTGLPTRPVNATIARLVAIEVSVFAGAMLLTGVAGALCVNLSLRPLERVARTASRVSRLQLGSGEVQLPERLPETATETEIGQVTHAFNGMLERVEAAFGERQESERLLRQFAADASHELRTPVAVIRSHAEFAQLATTDRSEQVTTALSRITAEALRMGSLVEDLLLLARLDSGRPLVREPVDLTRLVLDTVVDVQAVGSDHEWLLDLPEAETVVTGDANTLRQVLLNLLGNAREHTPEGTSVHTELRVEGDGTGEAATAVLTVTDDGPGIAPGFLPQVFERFARGDSSRHDDSRTGESGLGLSIARAIVQAHGGAISVASRPGRTVFTVRLPVATASSSAPAQRR